jgi:hypothetical protein
VIGVSESYSDALLALACFSFQVELMEEEIKYSEGPDQIVPIVRHD